MTSDTGYPDGKSYYSAGERGKLIYDDLAKLMKSCGASIPQFLQSFAPDYSFEDSLKNVPINREQENAILDARVFTAPRARMELLDSRYNQILADFFENLLQQVKSGYWYTRTMYVAIFITGLFVLAFSLLEYSAGDTSLFIQLLAAGSFLDVVLFMLFRPTEKLQNSRSNFAQVVAIMYGWYYDRSNWLSYSSSDFSRLNWHDMKDLSEIMMDHTDRAVFLLQKYTESSDDQLYARLRGKYARPDDPGGNRP